MRDKREPPIRESNRRGPRAIQDYDERMPRRKSKAAGSQDDRDRDSLLPKHRSMAIRPFERERDRESISYYQGRSGHASKLMSSEEAQKAIRTLFMQVKEDASFFADFRENFQREIRGVSEYAGKEMLEKLWEYKIRHNCETSHSSKNRSTDDGIVSRPRFDDVAKQLWESLHDAYDGARSFPSGQNDSMARKLDVARKEVCTLLSSVRTKSESMETLIKELKVLEVVLELGGAGKASHDDRANQRPRAHTDRHRHQRDSRLGGEDARYGGMTEHSGSEDDGQRNERDGEQSERSGGGEGREGDGDGDGDGDREGLFPHRSIFLVDN